MGISVVHATTQDTQDVSERLGDGLYNQKIFGSESKTHPPTHCAIFTIKKGESTSWLYPCHEFVVCLEGELCMVDEAVPGTITLKPGDVARLTEGTTMTWSSTTGGKGFSVTELPFDAEIKNYLA